MQIAKRIETSRQCARKIQRKILSGTARMSSHSPCLKTRMHTLQKCGRIIPSKDAERLPRTARGAFFVPFDRKKRARKERTEKKGNI